MLSRNHFYHISIRMKMLILIYIENGTQSIFKGLVISLSNLKCINLGHNLLNLRKLFKANICEEFLLILISHPISFLSLSQLQ